MAQPTIQSSPLDPNGMTGPVRTLGSVLRSGAVTTNVRYGAPATPEYARWLYVGTTGSLSYLKWDGTEETLTNVAAGVWHPICTIMVTSTATTALGLVWGS